jgi:dimeric dUTPase (all-alpha-NTP-PPase superfamily)
MNFTKLFTLQQNLDDKILQKHNLFNESLFRRKVLALQVELGEFANETRCFKYWSLKGPSERQRILEEYVDCLHFILSIGLEKKHVNINPKIEHSEHSIVDQIFNLYIDITDFITSCSMDHYLTLVEDFLSIGESLGFTEKEIEDIYLIKNNINHERQDNSY